MPDPLAEYKDEIQRGELATITTTTVREMKDALLIALQEDVRRYNTQYEAGLVWEVPQSTVSNIVTGRDSRFRASYLFDLVLRAGIKVQISVGMPS